MGREKRRDESFFSSGEGAPILGDPGAVSRAGRKGEDESFLVRAKEPLRGRDPFNQNFRKFRSKPQWIGSVQPEKFRKTGPPFEVVSFPGRTGLNFGSPGHFQKFKRMPAPDWAQKTFVLLCPISEQHLLSSFRMFVHDGYCLAILVWFVLPSP